MTSPVVVSRIQNRRGTQDQFEALYPGPYESLPGATSTGLVVTVNDTTGLYEGARPVAKFGTGQFAPGTKIVSVDSATQFTIDIIPTIPLSGISTVVFVERYNGIGGVPIDLYPNILLPGELALCTDSRRVFLGNINGEYVELLVFEPNTDLLLQPLVKILPPSVIWTDMPDGGIEYDVTPFLTVLYDVTDVVDPNWNIPGVNITRNGELKISARNPLIPNPANVTLTDNSSDINATAFDISFRAIYDLSGSKIKLQYTHNFPTNLLFSTSTIRWVPFIN